MNQNDLSSINKCKVIVKPGKSKNRILDFNSSQNILTLELCAIAKDNKANIELVKFLAKMTKRKVIIKSGLTSKEKIIEFV